MDDAPASTALAARVVTPISHLCPNLSEQQSCVVRGEVTICWPLNSVRQSFAFVLAEPDVRLRASHGQIRVQIDGPNAKAVAQSGIFSGDEVLLALDGAEWADNSYQDTRIPGSSSLWELRYPRRILLEFTSDSGETKTLDLDGDQSAGASGVAADYEVPIIDIHVPDAPAASSPVRLAELDEYASPAFIKRARLSYGSLLEADVDLFEEDGWVKGKGRKKARFGRYSNSWRYTSRSPSPESSGHDAESSAPAATASDAPPTAHPLQPLDEPLMANDGCQVVEADLTPEKARDSLEAAPSPAQEQPNSPAEAQLAGAPQSPVRIDDDSAGDDLARSTREDGLGQPSVSSSGDEPTQMRITFPAAQGFAAPSLGDYSSPRFAVNIPGSSSAYEGPSLEEQVRFGFHHSPASDGAVAGPDPTRSVLFPNASEATTLVDSQQPQTIPLWNLDSSQIMDRDHADAHLNIDPALVAAEAPGTTIDDQPLSFAGAESLGTLDNYNQRRFQNEAEDAMSVDAEDDGVKSLSDSCSDGEESEYERELANEAGDDYDMRAYADVDDDAEDDETDQEQADYNDGEIFEGGGSYSEEEEEEQEYLSDQADEERLYEDGNSESDGDVVSSPIHRAPAQPLQRTGPIVIDLLSDSSDDEDGDTEPPVPPVSASMRTLQHTAQDSPPSPSYEVRPDDRVGEDSEESEGYEGSEATEGSDIDASGESEDELDGFESPAQTTQPRDQPTAPLADATRGDDVSNAELSDDDDRDGDEMRDEIADVEESSMEAPVTPVAAARSDQNNHSADGDQVINTAVALPVDDKSERTPAEGAKVPLISGAPVRLPVDEVGMEDPTATHASNSDLESPSRVVCLEHRVGSSVDSQDITARPLAARAARSFADKEEVEHIDEVDLLVVPPPVTQNMDLEGPEVHHSAENTVSSLGAGDILSPKAVDSETAGQLPTPLDTQPEAVMDAQAAGDSMMQVDTQPSSQDDINPSHETQVASGLEVACATTTITAMEHVEVVELDGDDRSGKDSRSAVSADEEREDEEMADAEAPEQELTDDEMADARSDGSSLHSDELEVVMENASTIDSISAFATQEALSTHDEPLSPSDASDDTSVSDLSDDKERSGAEASLGTPTRAERNSVSGSQPHTAPNPSIQYSPINLSAPEEISEDAASSQASAEDTALDSPVLEAMKELSSDVEKSAPASPAQEPPLVSSPAVESGRGRVAAQSEMGFATQAPCSGDEYVNDDILTQPQNIRPSASNSPDAVVPADGPVSTRQQPSRFASQEPLSDEDQEIDDDAQSDQVASASEDTDESEDDRSTRAVEEADTTTNHHHEDASLDSEDDDRQESDSAKATPSLPKADFKIDIRDEYRVNDALPSPAQEEPRERSESSVVKMEVAVSSSPELVQASHGNASGAMTVQTNEETPTRKAPRNAKTNFAAPATSDPSIKLARAAAGVRNAPPPAEMHPGQESPCQPTTPAASLITTSPWSAGSSPNVTGQSSFQHTASEYSDTGRVIDRSAAMTPEQISKLQKLDVITSILGPDWGGTGGTPPPTITPRATNEVKKIAEAAQQLLPPALFEYFRVHLWTVSSENSLDELQGFFIRSFPHGTFPERKAVQAAKDIRRIINSRSNLKPRSETPQRAQDPSLKLAKAVLNSPSRNLRATNAGDGDADAAPETTTTTITGLKLEIGRFFRGNMADYTTLISLRLHPGKQLSVVGVVAAASKQPVRTKARQYAISISITDHTISPANVVEVQFYMLHREALPVTKPGDRVLLRNFTVVGLTDRGHGLRSSDASEYAVFDDKRDEVGGNRSSHKHEDSGDNDEGGGSSSTQQMAQIRGGPIELEDYEYEIATLLKNWYNLLPLASKEKLENANRKLATAGAAILVEG
ncbi:hypothetical protein RB595_002838 [Gaeumannomyces hyphopodioides]